MEIAIKYKGNMRFESGDENHLNVTMDANTAVGGLGEAPSPKQMLLHGLAGCTGLDVVSIIKKKGVEFSNFSLEVEAEQTGSHPKVFKDIHVTYRICAPEDRRKDIERAIELSTKTFCGVSHMLSKTAKLTHELVIESPM